MENINRFTKKLAVGDGKKYLITHSPNATTEIRSEFFEQNKYIRGNM